MHGQSTDIDRRPSRGVESPGVLSPCPARPRAIFSVTSNASVQTDSTVARLSPDEPAYQCPGESYTISRAIHLARLASSYPACADCIHRGDSGAISASRLRRLKSAWNRRAAVEVGEEAIAGRLGEEMDPAHVRNCSAACGVLLAKSAIGEPVRVVLGHDGRAESAELVAAATEGLRWSGADVIAAGETTAPGLVFAQHAQQAAGALLVGNPLGRLETAGLQCWGRAGEPWSSPGTLDTLIAHARQGVDRPTRSRGGLERSPSHALYVDSLRESYHALRPLAFGLETTCARLVRDLTELLSQVACRMIPVAPTGRGVQRRLSTPEAKTARAPLPREPQIDFGLWVDADGECCQVWDELGSPIPSDVLLLVLLEPRAKSTARQVVVANGGSPLVRKNLAARGYRTSLTGATRQAMHAELARRPAAGGAASGRIWRPPPCPAPDALWALTRLLQVLSQSDRPLSQVVRDALAEPPASR